MLSKRFFVLSQTAVISLSLRWEVAMTFDFTELNWPEVAEDASRIPNRQLDMGLQVD